MDNSPHSRITEAHAGCAAQKIGLSAQTEVGASAYAVVIRFFPLRSAGNYCYVYTFDCSKRDYSDIEVAFQLGKIAAHCEGSMGDVILPKGWRFRPIARENG